MVQEPGLWPTLGKHSEPTTTKSSQRNHHSEIIAEAGIMASARMLIGARVMANIKIVQEPGLWLTLGKREPTTTKSLQ